MNIHDPVLFMRLQRGYVETRTTLDEKKHLIELVCGD